MSEVSPDLTDADRQNYAVHHMKLAEFWSSKSRAASLEHLEKARWWLSEVRQAPEPDDDGSL